MLAYTDIGSGKALVLIHGLGSRKEAWTPQRILAEKFRLIILDLRGHGETELDEDISMKNFALDVINLLKHLGIERAHICGISLGGMVAQEIYKQQPDMVEGLILANTTSYIMPCFANILVEKTRIFLKDGSKDDLVSVIAKESINNQEYIQEAKDAFIIRDSYIESAKAPIGINYFPTLATIDKPILLISGKHDSVVPMFNQSLMYWFSQFGKRIEYLESGHLSNIEQKEKFNNLIIDFIGGR